MEAVLAVILRRPVGMVRTFNSRLGETRTLARTTRPRMTPMGWEIVDRDLVCDVRRPASRSVRSPDPATKSIDPGDKQLGLRSG
jgi:hypothetical protein